MVGQAFLQTLRGVIVFDLADNERVETGDLIAGQCDIPLRCARLLALQRVPDQESIGKFSIRKATFISGRARKRWARSGVFAGAALVRAARPVRPDTQPTAWH